MESPRTYYGVLQRLFGDPAAVDREKKRLDEEILKISSAIKARLTSETVPGLLWHLAFEQLRRVAPLIGLRVSDFSGQARFLRALCAAVPFSSVKPTEDPKTNDLLALCERLWSALFFREMLDELKMDEEQTERRQQFRMAALTSLLNAVQGDLIYVEQVEDRVRRVFTPFSAEIIEPAIGVGADDVIRGFRKVRSLIGDRMNSAANLSASMVEMWREFGRRYDAGASGGELDAFMQAPEAGEAAKGFQSSIDIFENFLLFTAEDLRPELGERCADFLKAFSFRPGEVNQTIVTPNHDDEVRRRPFAFIGDDRYILIDPCYCSFTPPRRLLECFNTDRKLQRLHKRRDDVLEEEAVRLFASVVEPDLVLRTYYVPIGDDGRLAERDLLLRKGSCLFLVESKARPLRPVSGRYDKLARIASDVERSIQEGYEQACDVIHYIRSNSGPVPFFDSDKPDRKQVAELDGAKITTVLPIVFLDAYYGVVATDLRPWLDVDSTIGFPWVVDRDTFESIILKIDSFEKLQEFLLWRRNLHGLVFNEDEAVFAGFYVRHGAALPPEGADLVQLDANYSDVFEAEYFRRLGVPVDMPPEGVKPPVWTKTTRQGDNLLFETDGKLMGSVNLMTGNDLFTEVTADLNRPERVGRNSPCPCGSGRKFKKCCLRVA